MNAMQSSPSRRIALFVVTAIVAVIVITAAGYTAYWYSAAAKVRASIDRWVADRRAAGWDVSLSEPRIGGFPFRIVAVVSDGRIAGPDGPERWSWDMPPVTASARPWTPQSIHVEAPGRHLIGTADGPMTAQFEEANGDIEAGPRSIRDVVLRFGNAEIVLPDGAAVKAGSLVVHLQESARVDDSITAANAEKGTGVAFDARDLVLPKEWDPALGPTIDRISVDAVITGNVVPRGRLAQVMTDWRDAGGALEVKALAADWQKLSLKADGTFALDEDLQPQGAMTAIIDGVEPTADSLIAAGVIDPQAAFAAKVANRALTMGGGPAKIPLTIQQQRLYLGPVPLLKLKPVKWD